MRDASMTTDTDAIREVIAQSYREISGPAGARDWRRYAKCFLDSASLRVVHRENGRSHVETMSLSDYRSSRGPFFECHAFFEREVQSDVVVNGDVAHAMSEYESRWSSDEPPFETGVNSIQLIRVNGEWRIASIAWVAGSAAGLLRR